MTRSAAEVDEIAANRRQTSEPAGALPAQRLGRVLVVEDERDVAELIRYRDGAGRGLSFPGVRGAGASLGRGELKAGMFTCL